MLSLLRVENLSVIESVTVEFTDGLNVITGETGAGKSVFIGALKLIMGERFNRALHRDESKKLLVEAVFNGDYRDINPDEREQFEIEDEIIIRRELDSSGKNRVYINGRMATLNQLKSIAESFADIHGQHEHQRLLDPSCHIEFIDSAVDRPLLEDYESKFSEYSEKRKKLEKIREDLSAVLREKDMLEFQQNEIESMNIDLEQDRELEERLGMLGHLEKIRENAAGALACLQDEEINASGLIGSASSLISSISSYSSELEKVAEQLSGIEYQVNDISAVLENIIDTQELDPEELERLTDRKFRLAGLMKKYGGSLEAVLDHLEEVNRKLESLVFDEETAEKLEKELSGLEKSAKESANYLNIARKKAASELSEIIEKTLGELELKNSVFKTEFTEAERLDPLGGIRAEFHLSTNPGFDPGPISRVASGGEISRVMLALKDVFASADRTETLVFDEIDTGISGRTARMVAKKLCNIAAGKQVIVITHLPVVAAGGEAHFHITKSLEGDRAKTDIKKLTGAEREEILATMIAGDATESSLEQARELLSGGD